ncbi:MAG: preprotein translocase subunit SecG [Azoarcus sp.]|jgi:preprotein translocase subunit SecG|nr:preprotein translocase subunit SecG [Azoarcus sp.]
MGTTAFNLVLLVHVLAGLGVIGLVLMQHGKGADMGAAFGSGASGSLFGSSGSANFLSRTTAVLATVFFITSLGLAYLASHAPKAPSSIMEGVSIPAETVPDAIPVPAPAPVPGTVPAGKGNAGEIPE